MKTLATSRSIAGLVMLDGPGYVRHPHRDRRRAEIERRFDVVDPALLRSKRASGPNFIGCSADSVLFALIAHCCAG